MGLLKLFNLIMSKYILEDFKKILAVPDLSSKKWIYEQYDSQVMNDTIDINGDAAIVRVHGTNKALALTSDCTPRYVKADPKIGAMQAVCETYRNISASGAKPLAITNCLNFGNPEKPEIMGQIVRAIDGINESCKFLEYPVISGNVSLYNETNGKAINPTPTIGGVGLLKDLNKRASVKFKNIDNEIFIIGKIKGHLDCSIYQRDILKINKESNPPPIDLEQEKNNSEFIRNLITNDIIDTCHDISDGGLLVALFEMCTSEIGCKIDVDNLKKNFDLDEKAIFFAEDQSCYIISIAKEKTDIMLNIANEKGVSYCKVGRNQPQNITFCDIDIDVKQLIEINNRAINGN